MFNKLWVINPLMRMSSFISLANHQEGRDTELKKLLQGLNGSVSDLAARPHDAGQ